MSNELEKNKIERLEAIKRWAIYIRENPNSWRAQHREFINAQFEMHEKFIEKMLKKKNGKKILQELYQIKNEEDYPSFF